MSAYPQFKTLSDISRYHGAENANRVALVFNDQKTTYRDLDQRANQIANALSETLLPQQRFAVLAKNNNCFFELLMGAGKCGAVLVAINWRLAAPEILYILKDSESQLLFIDEEYLVVWEQLREMLPAIKAVICFDADKHREGINTYQDWYKGHDIWEPIIAVAGTDTSMQLYTSGTTGSPKGVELSHSALLSLREAEHYVAPWSQWNCHDVALVPMPLFHIGGTATGLIALYNGACAVIMPAMDPGKMIQLMHQYKVTRTFLVPAVIKMLLDHPDCDASAFQSLVALLYGASPIPASLLSQALDVFQCSFAQIYGLTETAGSMTVLHPEDHSDPQAKKMSSCGRPYPGVEIAIVDQQGQRLAAHEVGEIIIKSPSLMTGYWKLPDATAGAMRDGWLYSGDAGYLDDEGYLYIHDRVKDMIVSGGENIYPAEVESALFSHPAVKDVAVIGVPSDKWGEEVKAVVVVESGFTDSEKTIEKDILDFTRKSIAGYKLPKSIDFVSELPRNASGKLLKREIRKPYWHDKERYIN